MRPFHSYFFLAYLLAQSTIQTPAQALSTSQAPDAVTQNLNSPIWAASDVEYIAGLPEVKAHKKGTLTLTPEELTFVGKAGRFALPKEQITAVSVGNQRVEMWGMTGRLLRMAIPDNGGLAVAAVAHHRIDMLTLDYNDQQGGAHSAIFFMGAGRAAQAIEKFALAARSRQETSATPCHDAEFAPGSMFVASPVWQNPQVPAAYRALVYEHLIERFGKAKNIKKVYRDGEKLPEGSCAQYTVRLSVTAFKEGSSVKRAMFGPVGMFVGTTQLVFTAQVEDRQGAISINEQMKTTIRGESESTNVADHAAKTLVKKYEKALRQVDKQHDQETKATS